MKRGANSGTPPSFAKAVFNDVLIFFVLGLSFRIWKWS